jgi:Zn-dependent protease
MTMTFISILILIVSIVTHEVAHGVAALWQGDSTAKDANRLTLNPISHIDPIGSIALPLLLYVSGSPFMFGWAKPVPINPYHFRNVRWGEAMVAFAGPLVNIIFVTIFTLLIHFVPMSQNFYQISGTIILINLVLALFNLMPIPPLDGSKILFAFVPQKYYKFRDFLEKRSFLISIIFILLLWQVFQPFVMWVFGLLV